MKLARTALPSTTATKMVDALTESIFLPFSR